jgi:hypothetical protein
MGNKSNVQYQCKGCVHKVSTNQLRGSKGLCIHCKTPMHHDNWRARTTNVATMLDLGRDADAEICRIARELSMEPNELIKVAILDRLRVWSADEDHRGAKDAMMLEKLYRR